MRWLMALFIVLGALIVTVVLRDGRAPAMALVGVVQVIVFSMQFREASRIIRVLEQRAERRAGHRSPVANDDRV